VYAAPIPFAGLRAFGGLGRRTGPAPQVVRDVRSALRKLVADAVQFDRILPGGLSERTTLPAISYVMAGSYDNRDFDGGDDLIEGRFRLSIWSGDSEEAALIARDVRQALLGFRGYVGQVGVLGIFLEGEIDMPEDPRDGSDDIAYQIILDLLIQYTE